MVLAAIMLLWAPISMAATPTYTYIGSFNVYDGPTYSWDVEPPSAFSAQQTAALIFGGIYSDYAISVDDSRNPLTITRTAWLDSAYSDVTSTNQMFLAGQSFSGVAGKYGDEGVYSAWVCDHAYCADGSGVRSAGWEGVKYTNYVWRVAEVPEPSSLALLLAGFSMLGLARVRRRQT